jgi:hypothetical protein
MPQTDTIGPPKRIIGAPRRKYLQDKWGHLSDLLPRLSDHPGAAKVRPIGARDPRPITVSGDKNVEFR